MHPEREIARDFWAWVNRRAHGDSLGYFPWSDTVWGLIVNDDNIAVDLGETTRREPWEGPLLQSFEREEGRLAAMDGMYNHETGLPATGFPTLQDALLDYLAAHIGTSFLAFKYDTWLRSVTLVVAGALSNPARLNVPIARSPHQPHDLDREDWTPHTMIVSDDWSVLSKSTFMFARRLWRAVAEASGQAPLPHLS